MKIASFAPSITNKCQRKDSSPELCTAKILLLMPLTIFQHSCKYFNSLFWLKIIKLFMIAQWELRKCYKYKVILSRNKEGRFHGTTRGHFEHWASGETPGSMTARRPGYLFLCSWAMWCFYHATSASIFIFFPVFSVKCAFSSLFYFRDYL